MIKLYSYISFRYIKKEITTCEKERRPVMKQQKDIMEKVSKFPGRFGKKFELALKKIKVNRQLYFQGTLVGNDVYKVMQKENINALIEVLTPEKLSDEEDTLLSSYEEKEKFGKLLFFSLRDSLSSYD